MSKKVIILGAGITGLGAGWKLARAGYDVEILDDSPCVGGMAASFRYNEGIYDLGTHGLHASKRENEEVMKAVKRLMGDELIRVTRQASIFFMGKRFNYPLKPQEIFLGMNLGISITCFLDFLKARIKNRLGPINKNEGDFETWMKNRFGAKLYDIYFGPYTKRVWGIDLRLLSSEWARTRIPVISLWDTIVKSFSMPPVEKSADLHSYSPFRKYFYYTHRGSGRIPEKIAEDIKENNGRIFLNSAVKKINIQNNRVAEIVVEDGDSMHSHSADIVISTIPINETVRVITPGLPGKVIEAAKELKFRAMCLLYLVIKKEYISSDQWVYFSEDGILFNRFSEFKNCSPCVMPDGKTALCLEITCFQDDDIWNMKKEEIFESCVNVLERYEFLRKSDIEDFFIKKLFYAYPLWDINYKRNLEIALNALSAFRNFYTIGRQGRFEYYNMDQCLEDGFKTASRIAEKEKY